MKCYRYSADTKEFVTQTDASLDPLETKLNGRDVWLLPANSTFTAPPDELTGFARVWNGNSWDYAEDHRGVEYWMPGDTRKTPPRKAEILGSLPDGAMLERPEMTASEIKAFRLEQEKTERAAAVAAITVTVDGMVFDGDETSQERMSRTVTAATATGASMDYTTTWVLHDNTVARVSIRQLAAALRLAGEAQTALWTVPYED